MSESRGDEIKKEIKEELKQEFFLVKRNNLIGGIIVALVAFGFVSYGAAKGALETVVSQNTIVTIEKGRKAAEKLIEGGELLPQGAIIFLGKNFKCPNGWKILPNTVFRSLNHGEGKKTFVDSVSLGSSYDDGSSRGPHVDKHVRTCIYF